MADIRAYIYDGGGILKRPDRESQHRFTSVQEGTEAYKELARQGTRYDKVQIVFISYKGIGKNQSRIAAIVEGEALRLLVDSEEPQNEVVMSGTRYPNTTRKLKRERHKRMGIGCGYCKFELTCDHRVIGVNMAKEGCLDYKRFNK